MKFALGVALALASGAAISADDPAWFTYTSTHPMHGQQTVATAQATETFNLQFPYSGEQRAELELRKRRRAGDVIFSIQRGQLVCGSSSCYVGIRWGDGPPLTFRGSPSSDGSSETIFIPGFGQFVKRLAEYDRVLIEVDIYQHGRKTFEFKTSGFDPTVF
ncbi:hypothetical protein PQS31_01760 [Luteimonas sp BLCC-B24]|uniref:hypothetical protein n=1 Tax=Luteimonas sp. BLCC-B24 TaxID=3025317 RepID=UPI00234E2E40|nr:hypothetical protein [Luteimonas sp. BLCC-B24]MDC7805557.1 hypothetical protein [Luteimonas sp. BLCC-B24]